MEVSLWSTKYIWLPDKDWFINKVFKTHQETLPIQEQIERLEKKKEYFWEYIPETFLCEIGSGDYIIKQKYIKWKILKEIDIDTLSIDTLSKLLDLIKKYLKYYKEQWWNMDITWYQYYPWNISVIRKKIKNFLTIYKNFLVSTNIIISDDWNPYIVDICESVDYRLQWKIKNFCAKPFIKRTISKLEDILKKKVNIENESINKELLETMNKQTT
jgi:hypothetical protein